MERAFKGIWIPKEIWLSNDLKIIEKVFLVEIDSLDNDNGCFASNDYFSKFFNLSKNRCSEIIKSLEKKQYITVNYKYKDETKCIEKRILKTTNKILGTRNIEGGIRETDRGTRNIDRGYSEKCEDNNININNTINIKKEKETNLDKLIKEYTSNEKLKEAFKDFFKMRKAIRKPLTDKGLLLLLDSLEELTDNESEKIEILEQSIKNSWTGVFPLKVRENYSNSSINNLNNNIQNTKYKVGAGANVNETFRNYNPDELERLLRESQRNKF